MTTYEYHPEQADRAQGEPAAGPRCRPAKVRRRFVDGLWWLFGWAVFSLAAAWGYAFFGLGCRGWACLLPLGG